MSPPHQWTRAVSTSRAAVTDVPQAPGRLARGDVLTFSHSPIADESGGVGGLFHPVSETTGTRLAERRTRALGDLDATEALAELDRANLATHGIEPGPQRAPIIVKLFEWYASGQYSLKALTKKAAAAGLTNRTGGTPLV